MSTCWTCTARATDSRTGGLFARAQSAASRRAACTSSEAAPFGPIATFQFAFRRAAESDLGGSAQPVEPHRAAGQHAMLGFRRSAFQPLAHHVRRAGEEPVAVRVVGRPHDL